jgi:hypothetical protein
MNARQTITGPWGKPCVGYRSWRSSSETAPRCREGWAMFQRSVATGEVC